MRAIPTFAVRLAALRQARGLTPHALAQAAGLTAQAIYDIEEGERTDPRVSTVCALAFALDVATDELAPPAKKKSEKK